MLPNRGVGWKYDLPPHDIASAQREACLASNLKINRAGRIFIEFPRSSVSVRGGIFFWRFDYFNLYNNFYRARHFHFPLPRLAIGN